MDKIKYHTQKTKYKGIGNPNIKHGRYIENFCQDCFEKISPKAIRCVRCNYKFLVNTKSGNYKKGLPKCIDCWEEVSNYGIERCWDCYIKWTQIPENNTNWNGGSSFEPYPLGWTKTFKEQIRFGDHYKCQICGCHEVENCRKLDIHHIDYNKDNLEENNLISLCQKCHGKTNFNREYWFKLLKDRATSMEKLDSVRLIK
jgi:hypothetical protein